MSKRRRQSQTQQAHGVTVCKTPTCRNQPAPGSRYCAMCGMTVNFQNQVNRANRRGDTIGALVNTGLALLFDGIRQGKISVPGGRHGSGAGPAPGQSYRQYAPPPPPPKVDPFAVLGLDVTSATEKDVRRIQRGAAEMWHEDKGGGIRGQDRLAEINSAAEACLRILRKRPIKP